MHTSYRNTPEHFVTLFDAKFLPMGMALHRSLERHAQPFHLWIVCVDDEVERHLSLISLPNVTIVPLREVETPELLAVKTSRNRAEYCWTLTPFAPLAIFNREQAVRQVTYLDADVFFFDNPMILLAELEEAGKSVLVTEHAYAPEYDNEDENGRFCVQFLTFRNSREGHNVMRWWQERCLEWCYHRCEEGKFGDQKYLDLWPALFADDVHILRQTHRTLAPWNVRYFERCLGDALKPVIYHFHGLRIIGPNTIMLYYRYRIGARGLELYAAYVSTLKACFKIMGHHGIPVPFIIPPKETMPLIRLLRRKLAGFIRYETF